jgi:hypothetical protein
VLCRDAQAKALPAAKLEGIKSRMKQHKAAGTIAAPAVRLVPAPSPAPSSSARSLYLLRSTLLISQSPPASSRLSSEQV